MKNLKDIILEKLVLNKHTKMKHPLSIKELDLLQRVFRFYVENYLSTTTIHNISRKNEIDDKRYNYTIEEITEIISTSKRENLLVNSILFNNEFKSNQEIIVKIEELFNKINNNKDNSFINQVKEELLKAINYFN